MKRMVEEVPNGSKCMICFKEIDNLNGDPNMWGVALPFPNGNGRLKHFHRGCVANIVTEYIAHQSASEIENRRE